MGFIQLLSVISQLIVPTVSLMVQAEQVITGSGKGSDKKNLVLNTVQTAAQQAGTKVEEVQTMLPVVSSLVDMFATLFNKHEAWGQVSAALSVATQATQVVSDTIKNVESAFPSSGD